MVKHKVNVDSYVTGKLFGGQSQEAIMHIITCVRNIRMSVKNLPGEPTPNIKSLCSRLELCRNQDNNPDSAQYKRKLEELVDEEDLLMQDHIPMKQARMETGDNLAGVKVLSPGGG